MHTKAERRSEQTVERKHHGEEEEEGLAKNSEEYKVETAKKHHCSQEHSYT